MRSFFQLLVAIVLLRLTDAVPALAVIITTSTRSTTITSCSCLSTSKSGTRTSTITLPNSSSCASKGIRTTCKTTTSTIKTTITSSSSVKSSTSTRLPSSTSTKPLTTSTSTKPITTSTSTKPLTTSTSTKPVTTSTSLKSSTTSTTTKPSTITSSKTTTTTTSSFSHAPTPVKDTGKRGLAYNDPNLTLPFSFSGQSSKVSWAYNWYSYPYTIGQTQSGYNPALAFAPMLWSAASDLTSVWASNVAASIAAYGTTAVLAFNEPDGCGGGGSCMNLSVAVTGYQTWMNPLAGKVRLGAPAVTNGGGEMGLTYLSNFIRQCTGCHIDFVPIHWYGDAGNSSGFEWYVGAAYAAAGGRPLWVTEMGTTSGTEAQIESFLTTTQAFMDGSAMVEKYAWFFDSPGYLINANGTGLSATGSIYNNG